MAQFYKYHFSLSKKISISCLFCHLDILYGIIFWIKYLTGNQLLFFGSDVISRDFSCSLNAEDYESNA